jgi:multicomponent Na+:H+ antiporter subunit B
MLGVVDVLLLAFLLVVTLGIIRLHNLFSAVMLTGIFSLLSAGLYVVMDAVDVAFTEASVGAGISTVLMLGTLSLTRRWERAPRRRIQWGALTAAALVGAAFVYGTFDMPAFGDPEAPIHTYMAPHFIEDSQDEVGPPNVVTSVLASYRGYDTFGETTVIFTAAIGVLALMAGSRRHPSAGREKTAGQGDSQ